jgi:hypothetical protein
MDESFDNAESIVQLRAEQRTKYEVYHTCSEYYFVSNWILVLFIKNKQYVLWLEHALLVCFEATPN